MSRYTKNKNTPKYITELARKNRRNLTFQEAVLWEAIAKKKVFGIKFRRQFPIGRYIVDFYNHRHKLVVEIDGEVHNDQKEYDKNRDDFLKSNGCRVIHFTNNDIEGNMDKVLNEIVKNINNTL